jgi:hypothetical protein
MKYIFSLPFFLFPLFCLSQSSYDKLTTGTWEGVIYGGGLPEKKLIIVITRSNNKESLCEGYSMVNSSNKTSFKGKLMVEADMPIIEGFEPKTNPNNGIFHLEFGCSENDEIIDDLCCGTWISYNKKIKRMVRVKKIRQAN